MSRPVHDRICRSRRARRRGIRTLVARVSRVTAAACIAALVITALVPVVAGAGAAESLDLTDTSRLRIGIGDRLRLEREGKWVTTLSVLDRLDTRVDLLQIWLPRGWQKD